MSSPCFPPSRNAKRNKVDAYRSSVLVHEHRRKIRDKKKLNDQIASAADFSDEPRSEAIQRWLNRQSFQPVALASRPRCKERRATYE